jgi:hypothetical protein
VTVKFLSDDQVSAYGHYAGPPECADWSGSLFLDDADRAIRCCALPSAGGGMRTPGTGKQNRPVWPNFRTSLEMEHALP